jgi:hypothetical protein
VDRLSHWWVAAWVALCLSGLAIAAAIVLPAAFRSGTRPKGQLQASLTPRTHLFGQTVTAVLELPAGSTVKSSFTPYRVVRRETLREHTTVQYRFTLQCLRPACAGAPGVEHDIALPPIHVSLPGGKSLDGYWPPLREASRLGPNDLYRPQPRGTFMLPERRPANRALGIGLAMGAGLALVAAGLLGVLWLAPRRFFFHLPERNGRPPLSELQYALVVTGLAAGGGSNDRRAALESLAVALDQEGQGELASQARSVAWSPREPRGDAVRQLAAAAQQLVKGGS